MVTYDSEATILNDWMYAVYKQLINKITSDKSCFKSTDFGVDDFDIILTQRNENSKNVNEEVVSFARETMKEQDFDSQFPPRYTIRFQYNGTKQTMDDVTMLNVHQSNFIKYYEYFHFQRNMNLDKSINSAVSVLYNSFTNWINTYFKE